ncbi:MAG: hypothetical protein OXH63_16965 [Gemmatimonadetes bacterium]|nr:hypothetical protein [Gemmatimonadota bacterium]
MKSRTTRRFRNQLQTLPDSVQQQAKKAYQRFKANPWHNALCFKQVHPTRPIYSVRVTKGYRAVGKRDDKGVLWFWIGSHVDYDELIRHY